MTIVREHGQLLLDMCHFSHDLNPLWDKKKQILQLKALANPMLDDLGEKPNQQQQLQKLAHYFFTELGFTSCDDSAIDLPNIFLPEVIRHKSGPTPLLMLLFCTLLEEAGIATQVTSCRMRHLLKVELDGHVHIIDFDNQAKPLAHHEIVDLINRGFDFSSGALNSSCLVVEYLSMVKERSRDQRRLQILSQVHSYLMKYQPFNLKHLSERAMVAYETGNYRMAINDIRSYFLYKQPEFTNQNLKKIYRLALRGEKLNRLYQKKRDEMPLSR